MVEIRNKFGISLERKLKGPLEGYDVKHDLGLGADGIAVGRRRTDSANYANSSTVLLLSYKQGKTLFKVVVSYYLDQINLDRAPDDDNAGVNSQMDLT